MSLDISVSTDDTSQDINWLRNPFGLERWAHGNLTHLLSFRALDLPMDLYDVCNTWSYDKADQIDRRMFKRVVDAYYTTLMRLNYAYFWFDDTSYQHFTQRNPRGRDIIGPLFGRKYADVPGMVMHANGQSAHIGIPMEMFTHAVYDIFLHRQDTLISQYKEWLGKLGRVADLLQDHKSTFYCSN